MSRRRLRACLCVLFRRPAGAGSRAQVQGAGERLGRLDDARRGAAAVPGRPAVNRQPASPGNGQMIARWRPTAPRSIAAMRWRWPTAAAPRALQALTALSRQLLRRLFRDPRETSFASAVTNRNRHDPCHPDHRGLVRIGAATARRTRRADTAIALHARKNRVGADKVAQLVRAAGGKALVVEGDLAKPDTARRLVDETAAAFGRLDVVVSNAGFADRRAIGTLDRAAWDESLSAMTSAFFELATAARPWLVKAGADGRLVGVSSFVAHAYARGLPMFPPRRRPRPESRPLPARWPSISRHRVPRPIAWRPA